MSTVKKVNIFSDIEDISRITNNKFLVVLITNDSYTNDSYTNDSYTNDRPRKE